MTRTIEERFWPKVQSADADDCWLWTAAKIRGYGAFNAGNNRIVYAHRMAYELLIGPIPAGLTLDHLCRTPACVNPFHCDPVPGAVNTSRAGAAKVACRWGHPFTPANTYVRKDTGARQCRTCKRERDRQWVARRNSQEAA